MKPSSVEVLPSRIRQNKTLSAKKVYIVQGEVRVLKNVLVTIQDQVTILLINGVFEKSCVRRSTLIFDQGSRLKANKVFIRAANESFKPVKSADNGGLGYYAIFK